MMYLLNMAVFDGKQLHYQRVYSMNIPLYLHYISIEPPFIDGFPAQTPIRPPLRPLNHVHDMLIISALNHHS
jgi:hypothetical protein